MSETAVQQESLTSPNLHQAVSKTAREKKRPAPTPAMRTFSAAEKHSIVDDATIQEQRFLRPNIGQVVSKEASIKKRQAPSPPVRNVLTAETLDIGQVESGSNAILHKSFTDDLGRTAAETRRSIPKPEAHITAQRATGALSGKARQSTIILFHNIGSRSLNVIKSLPSFLLSPSTCHH